MAAINYGTVAIVPKGEYDEGMQYNVGNLVSYNGSSYVAKMIPPVGTLPTDTSYWQLSAQGGGAATENDLGVVKPDNTTIGIEEDGTLKSILTSALLPSTDTSGLLGQANATVNTQALIDAIADKIMTKLVTDDALTTRLANYVAKSMMTGIQVNSSDKVPTSALAYAMNELITGLRADVDSLNAHMDNALAYSIYGKILEGNATLNITVQVNSTFLVFVSNAYNNGAFYMLCTGRSVEKCVLIPIVENSYFTLEPVGIDTFKISSGNANGRIYVIHIGAAY